MPLDLIPSSSHSTPLHTTSPDLHNIPPNIGEGNKTAFSAECGKKSGKHIHCRAEGGIGTPAQEQCMGS